MNKIYNANKIYLVKLAKVTDVVESTWFTSGSTRSRTLEKSYFAKLVKVEDKIIRKVKTFKIISKGMLVVDDHNKTKIGDYYVVEATPIKMLFDENFSFITKNDIFKAEELLNNKESQQELNQ